MSEPDPTAPSYPPSPSTAPLPYAPADRYRPAEPYGAESYSPPEPFSPPGQFRGGPTSPYAAHYPAPYPPPPGSNYGAYPGYPTPDRRDDRPGTVVGASVLGFIEAGVLLFASIWLWIVASIISAVGNAEENNNSFYASHFHGLATFLVVAGILNVVSSALLITGGVLWMQRKIAGAIAYLAGVLVVIATFITWLVAQDHVFWFGELTFIVLPVVGVLIAIPGGTWTWLRAGRSRGATGPR